MFAELIEAVRFLTIFPLPSSRKNPPAALARSMFFFPLVGALIGGICLVLFLAARSFFPPSIAVLGLLIVSTVTTGGLHLDGFGDFCDGFFGAGERTEILRIMKDSRIGAFGAAGVTLLLLSKFELLQVILPHQGGFFLLSLAAARWAQVVLSFFLPYAGSQNGIGSLAAGEVGIRELSGATFFLVLAVLAFGKRGLIIFAALPVFLFLLGYLFKKRIGGITGDLLGAASELTEIFVLVSAAGLPEFGK